MAKIDSRPIKVVLNDLDISEYVERMSMDTTNQEININLGIKDLLGLSEYVQSVLAVKAPSVDRFPVSLDISKNPSDDVTEALTGIVRYNDGTSQVFRVRSYYQGINYLDAICLIFECDPKPDIPDGSYYYFGHPVVFREWKV